MFTNWLTSPTTTTTSTSVNQNVTPSTSFVGQLPANLMTTPPDIILEVGPPPSVRFVAHSSLLAMHSGYLRSAIRLDENNGNLHNTIGGPVELPPIYLTNVTPEQFGPLLTYMYTGYLDLTLENIFGVLLATHVLHMPRALEICRAFLARSQAEGFLNGNYLNQLNSNNNNNCELNTLKNTKIIRPIPSKPIISSLGFIVPPMQHISLPSTDTPFRSLSTQNIENFEKVSNKISTTKQLIIQKPEESNSSNPSPSGNSSPLELKSKPSTTTSPRDNNNQNNLNQNLTRTSLSTTPTLIVKRSPKLKRSRSKNSTITATTARTDTPNINSIKYSSQGGQSNQSNQNQTINNSSDQDNENKVIIDVASCDGPVRFRRVLNDAYGRQPDSVHIPPPQHERSHESVSYSFHQQMAKNISQQRHQQQNSEESENSEDIKNNNNTITNHQNSSNSNTNGNGNGETFNCVYCKHTFKSQYCYQKHAKRHLNPLSLEQGEGIILAPSATSFRDLFKETTTTTTTTTKSINSSNYHHNHHNQHQQQQISITSIGMNCNSISNNNKRDSNNTTNDIIINSETDNNNTLTGIGGGGGGGGGNNKREVRPLDMNVQYYPCKTCGSKFPSYYFVHKHRKMCHSNEEN